MPKSTEKAQKKHRKGTEKAQKSTENQKSTEKHRKGTENTDATNLSPEMEMPDAN